MGTFCEKPPEVGLGQGGLVLGRFGPSQGEKKRGESWDAAQKQREGSSLPFFPNSGFSFCFQIILHFEICLKLQTFCKFSKYSWPS
jgi:hypothetical protein